MKNLKVLFLTLLWICSFQLKPQADCAETIHRFLGEVSKKFDTEGFSREDQFQLISKPINTRALLSTGDDEPFGDELNEIEGLQFARCKEGIIRFGAINPFMLAICLGEDEYVEKFLTCVDDINDFSLASWGYRQPYFPSHMALDPRILSDDGGAIFVDFEKIDLLKRLRIITLLGLKGANFSLIPPRNTYQNPPLVSAGLNAVYQYTNPLRARALLYGADFFVSGSTRGFVCINPTSDCPLGTLSRDALQLCELAFDDYLKMSPEEQERTKFSKSVLDEFVKINTKRASS